MYITFIDTKFLIRRELYVQYMQNLCISYCTDCMLVCKSHFMSLDVNNIYSRIIELFLRNLVDSLYWQIHISNI